MSFKERREIGSGGLAFQEEKLESSVQRQTGVMEATCSWKFREVKLKVERGRDEARGMDRG